MSNFRVFQYTAVDIARNGQCDGRETGSVSYPCGHLWIVALSDFLNL